MKGLRRRQLATSLALTSLATAALWALTLGPLAHRVATRDAAPAGLATRADRSFYRAEMAAIPHLHLINYFPARNSWAKMWSDWRPQAVSLDMARIAGLHGNAVRIIINSNAFGFPEPRPNMVRELGQAVKLARSHGLRVQLTLFDQFSRWGDITGSRAWARSILQPYRADPEIAFIELRNELDTSSSPQMRWAAALMPTVHSLGRGVPVTISVTAGLATLRRGLASSPPSFYDLHYYGEAGLAERTFATAQAAVAPALLFIGEFGFSTWTGNTSVPGLPASTLAMQAYQDYYYRTIELATRVLGLPAAAPWTLNDLTVAGAPPQPSPAQFHFGIYQLDGRPKPVAATLRRFFSAGSVSLSFNGNFTAGTSGNGLSLPDIWQRWLPAQGHFDWRLHGGYSGGGQVALSATSSGCPGFEVTPVDGFVQGGVRVAAAAFARAQGAIGPTSVSLAWFNAHGVYMSQAESPLLKPGGGTWTRLQASGAAPVGAAFVDVFLRSCASAGRVWFSDVSFS